MFLVFLNQGAKILNQEVYIVPWGGSEEALNQWEKKMIKFHEEGNTLGVFSFTYFYSFIFFIYFYMWRNHVQINLRGNLFPQNNINTALRSRPCLPCHSRSYIKSILWSLYMCLNV